MPNTLPVLIAGLPRSGTTWVGEVLSSAQDTRYIFEPDNEGLSPIAWFCKRNIHRYPYLTLNDTAADYHKMWDNIIHGHSWAWYANAGLGLFMRRIVRSTMTELEAHMGDKCGFRYVDPSMHWVGPHPRNMPYIAERHPFMVFLARWFLAAKHKEYSRRMIIKSVHTPLCLEWLDFNFPVEMIVVLRNPYSLYASYKRMKLPDGQRNILIQSALQNDKFKYIPKTVNTLMPQLEDPVAFQIMFIYKIIQTQLGRHPNWRLISHDRLCITPYEDYKSLFDTLGLIWSDATNERLDSLNKPGKGFTPARVSKQEPFRWKSELTAADRKAIDDWIDRFELRTFFREQVNLE